MNARQGGVLKLSIVTIGANKHDSNRPPLSIGTLAAKRTTNCPPRCTQSPTHRHRHRPTHHFRVFFCSCLAACRWVTPACTYSTDLATWPGRAGRGEGAGGPGGAQGTRGQGGGGGRAGQRWWAGAGETWWAIGRDRDRGRYGVGGKWALRGRRAGTSRRRTNAVES